MKDTTFYQAMFCCYRPVEESHRNCMSNGARQELVKALTEIFSGRVCLYTGDFP